MTARTAYFQEEDYCRVELLPAHNLAYCRSALHQMVPGPERGEDPAAPASFGYRPLPLVALGIDFAGILNLFGHHLPAFDRVETGYARHTAECHHIRAFGYDEECTIFISHNETRFVDCIWFAFGMYPARHQDQILAALHSLDALGPLLFIDWICGRVFALHESMQMTNYLQECTEALVELADT